MNAWEKADAVVALLDDGIADDEVASRVGVNVKEMYRYERVARLWPRQARVPGLAFSTYQTIAEACIGSPDKPDPIRTMKAFLSEPGQHTGATARTWFAKHHRTTRRSRRRVKVRAVPQPVEPTQVGWVAHWVPVRCESCHEVMALRPDVKVSLPEVWCATCAADKWGVATPVADLHRSGRYAGVAK